MKTNIKGDFTERHIGPNPSEVSQMLTEIGEKNLNGFIGKVIPEQIRLHNDLKISLPLDEKDLITRAQEIASQNEVFKTYTGQGYYGTFLPPVIQRNIFENPGWYTQYTPYQAEIAQGRLEALLNFQTMVSDLTGLPVSNASLLDEATAAAEAMTLAYGSSQGEKKNFFISKHTNAQTIAVCQTRAEPLGIEITVSDHESFDLSDSFFGAIIQYPRADGKVKDETSFFEQCKKNGVMSIVATDLLALCLIKSPGEMGADIAVGSSQRFGVPMGFGGPHAAFLSTKDEFKRQIPGRIIGVSKDKNGSQALRLALQTREQHIRREKATSNICTAQVLLAIIASMYAVYHGPKGLKKIALKTHFKARTLMEGLRQLGIKAKNENFFDTLTISTSSLNVEDIKARSHKMKINLNWFTKGEVRVSLDECTSIKNVEDLLILFNSGNALNFSVEKIYAGQEKNKTGLERESSYLTHPVFNSHHSETEMLRYIKKLESRDLSLAFSMIPLGSCTMKLNATTEMLPVTLPGFSNLHPYIPLDQAQGYIEMFSELEADLCEITGFDSISLQPNAGSQGEYAGLLAIRKYHESRNESHRNICLIPQSAHGTNPASAALAGMKIVSVLCDKSGNVDISDLKSKAQENSKNLSALMITYPSTHGVFEKGIKEICQVVHDNGGQVYMDGANMNAQVGLCKPGEYGPDVCHLNLHKTFAIPHGGGGPGMGPIGVKKHLAPHLPTKNVLELSDENSTGAISAAPWGSSSILPISWSYIKMLGSHGLRYATEIAILNANYMSKKLSSHYPILYQSDTGFVAHECIIDLRPIKASTGIEVEDIAKRLIDYGFHAPTISFPVAGTMMIEPTESESKAELDRFCEAMISIRKEIAQIENGKIDKKNNPLKNAPHTVYEVTGSEWDRPYSREEAAFPVKWLRDNKFWPSVARIDNVYGDRNLMCSCPPVDSYE